MSYMMTLSHFQTMFPKTYVQFTYGFIISQKFKLMLLDNQ